MKEVRKWCKIALNKSKGNSLLWFAVFVLVLAVLAVLLYRRYLPFGPYTYVFAGGAIDSYRQTLPNYMDLARKIRESGGRIPGWNYLQYLGMPQASRYNILDIWPCFFGEYRVAKLLGSAQIIKVVLAGSLFFIFMQKARFSRLPSFAISLGYALCGHMVVRGAWTGYPAEVVAVALMMYALECFFRKERGSPVLPLAVLYMAVAQDLYRTLLYAAVFFFYALMRFCTENLVSAKSLRQFLSRYLLHYGIGLLLATPLLYPQMLAIANGARLSIDVQAASDGITGVSNPKTMAVAYLRTLSNDIVGAASVSSAIFYCGLLPLLALPHCFYQASRKKKLWYAVCLLAVVAYCLFDDLRMVANGFSNNGFRLSSFWIVLLLLFLGAQGLEKMLRKQISWPLLWGTLLVLLAPGMLLYIFSTFAVSLKSLLLCSVFLSLYVIIFWFLRRRNGRVWYIGLLVAVALEIFMTTSPVIDSRRALVFPWLEAVYHNGVGEVAAALKQDDTDLFRVDYSDGLLCQSLAQNFLSTRGYIGGASLGQSIYDFHKAVDNESYAGSSFVRFYYGFTGMDSINTLLGTRYLIYDTNRTDCQYVPYGYEAVTRKEFPGSLRVYENRYALPLLFAYDATMSHEEFLQLSKVERRDALLDVLVVEEGGASPLTAGQWREGRATPARQELPLATAHVTDQQIVYQLQQKTGSPYLVISARALLNEKTGDSYTLRFEWGAKGEADVSPNHRCERLITRGDEDILFTIDAQDVEELRVSCSNEYFSLDHLRLYAVDHTYFADYVNAVERRRENPVTMTYFEQDEFEVQTEFAEDQYLFASIAYHSDWSCWIDGEPARIEHGNIGFMAVAVPAGVHRVVWRYETFIPASVWIVFACGALCYLGHAAYLLWAKRKKTS